MRLSISNDKSYMINILEAYLNQTLYNKYVEAIINGTKYEGRVEERITFSQSKGYYVMTVFIGKEKEEIPLLLDKTKIRVGKNLFVFETEKHSTVIELSS